MPENHFTDGDLLFMLQILTLQQTAQKLKQQLKSLVEMNLPKSRLQIFEIRTIRNIDPTKPDFLISVDAINPDHKVAEINEIEDFPEAIKTNRVVRKPWNNGTRMIFPLMLATTSHVIVFDYPGERGAAVESLFSCFGNLLEQMRSKDLDQLTGFYNRYAFTRIMEEIANNPYDVDKRPFTTLAILDLDHFKRVNDTYGHLVGDETLHTFAKELCTVFRYSDVIIRYGGEEFVVILKEVDSKQAHNILKNCRKRIEKCLFPEVKHMTVSIGFATIADISSPMLALDRADRALYYAKEKGRNRVCSYDILVADGTIDPVEEKDHKHRRRK